MFWRRALVTSDSQPGFLAYLERRRGRNLHFLARTHRLLTDSITGIAVRRRLQPLARRIQLRNKLSKVFPPRSRLPAGILTPAECSIWTTADYLQTRVSTYTHPAKQRRSKMKTLIAALALLSLAAGPAFAQTFTPRPGYYPWDPANGSLGGESPIYNRMHPGE
jgi:hypothetical protein